MKAKNIHKLYELLKEYEESVSWETILKFTREECECLIKAIDEKDENAYALFLFYLKTYDEKSQFSEDEFKHLQIENVKEVIAQEVLHASTPQMAANILDYFDVNLAIFRTKEEFLTYLRSMPKTKNLGVYYSEGINALLSNYEKNRIELIQKYATYYDSVSHPIPLSRRLPEIFIMSSASMQTFLELAARNYDYQITAELSLKWDAYQRANPYRNQEIEAAKGFLMEENIHSTLGKIFLEDEMSSYIDIINTVHAMQDCNCINMIYNYINNEVEMPADKQLLREKIREVLEQGDPELMNAFDILLYQQSYWRDLLNGEYSPDEKNERMNAILEKLSYDKNTMVLTKLLLAIPYASWEMIAPDAEKETLEIILDNLWLYQDRVIFDRTRLEETGDVFAKLAELSVETNQKFVQLLDFFSFLDDPRREEILDILLSKEHEPSFDYIFKQYQEQENIRKQAQSLEEKKSTLASDTFQVELATVVDLLNSGYHADVVLEGFEEDDDITVKTLVRSMKYRESC